MEKQAILLTVVSLGETIASNRLKYSLFQKGSGVKTLLDANPDAVVEIHKPDGISLRYEFVK